MEKQGFHNHFNWLNLSLVGCLPAEPISYSIQHFKNQFQKLYLQPVIFPARYQSKMRKIGYIIFLAVFTTSAFGQQFLWSTINKDGVYQVPLNRVAEEVLKFYDHYKLYYDYSGYSKKRFIEEIADGFDDIRDLNNITEFTDYAVKSNLGYGSFVLVACISEENVDMILFSNTAIEGNFSFEQTHSYERDRFVRWFKMLINEDEDSEVEIGTVHPGALYPYGDDGGGGSSLDLTGWRWDYIPRPNDRSREDGRIVFEIKVDDSGAIIGVRTLEKSVSPALEQLYRREVEKLTFSPTSSNTIPAPISTGKITFVVRTD
jgi:hypothetical protein